MNGECGIEHAGPVIVADTASLSPLTESWKMSADIGLGRTWCPYDKRSTGQLGS